MALSLLEVLRRGSGYLAARGSDSPRLDTELILGSVLGLSRLHLYLQFERPLLPAELDRLRPLLRRRAEGCPVAYLVGTREFMGLEMAVSPAVLIPRPETEQLVERGLSVLAARPAASGPPRAADLGTGSGCIAIALADRDPRCTVDAVDRSAAALAVAAGNVDRHHLADRVRLWQGDWAEPLRGRGPYDLVLANPPYVTTAEMAELPGTVAAYEPRLALDGGPDGLAPHRAILAGVAPLLGPAATLILEVDPRRAGALAALCEARWPDGRCTVRADLAGRDRVVETRLPPLPAAALRAVAVGS